jgi:hypothetical protein
MSLILTSIRGRQLGLDSSDRLIVPKGVRAGDHGNQFDHISPIRVVQFDDFDGGAQTYSTTVVDGWRSRKGSDGACVDWTVTPALNGTVVGTIGSTTASMAVSGVQIDGGLMYRCDSGDLEFQARVKLSTISNIAVFLGLTNQTAALQMPIQSAASADTFTANAADAVGVMFDTSMATKNWWLVGNANSVQATQQNSAIAPVAATYEIWRVGLSAAGVATFFRNGQQVGISMAGAVTPSTLLTPVIAGFNRTTTGTPTITADYLYVSSARV